MMTDKKDMKIVVTGSTGMVGSHLVAELLKSGYRNITLPVRNRGRLAQLYKTLAREGFGPDTPFGIVETTLNNPAELPEVFAGAAGVFNCAAVVSIGGMDDRDLIRTNVEITQHVVNASLKAGIGKLVHVSSIAALGIPQDGVVHADENSIMESLAGASGYAVSKFLSENEVMRGAYEGLRAVVVSPCAIIGSGDWRGGSSVMIPFLAKGLPFYTEGVTAWVDVKDVAKAMVLLFESDKAVGEKYVLAAENLTFRELITMSNAASGHRPPRIHVGRRLINTARTIDKLLAGVTRRAPLLTGEIAKILLDKDYYSGEKIKKTVTFDYTPVDDTIRRVVNDYLSEKNG